jgi:sugar lactone lactonase YvrE
MFARHLLSPWKGDRVRIALLLGSLLAALASGTAAHAVTSVTVDGHPDPVTLTVGETVTVRWDTAKTGGNVQYTLVRDISGTGKYDPVYPFTRANPIVDGGAGDSDPAPGKIAWSFTVDRTVPAGRYVLHLRDFADTSVLVSSVWTVVPKPEAQAISGRVAVLSAANPAGTPPPDAVVWAATSLQTLVASASIKPDGSYTLPLPPGTYIVFAEWLGNLRSQRQVVQLAAGQQQSNADLALLQGQEVSGAVRIGGQPAADALVQAAAADGRTFAAHTFADGTYLLVLPGGAYQITAPGGSERVTVADGAVDGVDFPAPTPAPTPTAGTIVTVVGNGASTFGGDGRPAVTARLPNPINVAMDAAGNLYIVDNVVNRVRKVDAKTQIITTVAGSRTIDAIRFLLPQLTTGGGFSGDGGPAIAAQLDTPQHLAVDAAGNLYISDLNNYRVRKVDTKTGIITTVAGSGPTGSPTVGAFAGDGGPATAARLNRPQGVAVDAAGNLYIADQSNGRVRKVSPEGIMTTVAGGGAGALADGAKATEVAFNFPREVAVDGAGNLYISDSSTRIVKVSPAGVVSLVAGTGTPGFSGDGGPATAAQYNTPFPRMAVDRAGSIYFSDILNERVRKVSPEGMISTVAGTGERGFGGDGGPATAARLAGPSGVAIDAAGNLYFAEGGNKRIRKVIGVAAPGLIGGQ